MLGTDKPGDLYGAKQDEASVAYGLGEQTVAQVSLSLISSNSEICFFEPEECQKIIENAITRIWLINDKKLTNHITFT